MNEKHFSKKKEIKNTPKTFFCFYEVAFFIIFFGFTFNGILIKKNAKLKKENRGLGLYKKSRVH